MKKLAIFLGVILVFLLAVNVQAGQPLGPQVNVDLGIAQPHSHAFGASLDELMEAWLWWFLFGTPPKAGNVTFLPLPDNGHLYVEVKPGTALVLPVALWLGYVGEPLCPPERFGDEAYIWATVSLDGEEIIENNWESNQDYYFGEVYFDPPIWDLIAFLQGIGIVINPLTPGDHTIELHAFFAEGACPFGDESTYDNTWTITVTPPGQDKN